MVCLTKLMYSSRQYRFVMSVNLLTECNATRLRYGFNVSVVSQIVAIVVTIVTGLA